MSDREPSATVPRPRTVPASLVRLCTDLHLPFPATDPQLTGVVLDSRAVQPGDLYAALPGHTTHGGRFARNAVAAGALAVLTDPVGQSHCAGLGVPVVVVDDPRAVVAQVAAVLFGRPATRMQMLGVTGTNGKTTVTAMVDAALRAADHVTGTIGTTGVRIGEVSYPGARTTPESTDLQSLLFVMAEAGVDAVVMEASSIAVVERRLDALVFDVVGFTNLSQDHLDYHGSMPAYFTAKAALFTPEHARLGIVGVDDEWGRELVRIARIPVQTWSATGRDADWTVEPLDGRADLVVHGPGDEQQRLTLTMPGAFNSANAACAYAMARAAGVPPEEAARGISATVVPGRMQVVVRDGGLLGVVDYAHTPDAIDRVLTALRDEVPGRLLAVVGAGGDRDRGKRPLMGAVAARLADVVVVTDDNPRSEDPSGIRAAVLEGIGRDSRARVLEQGDRRQAITVAVGMAEAGDAIVVLGKGHEQGQEVRGVTTPFDDADELRIAVTAELARRSTATGDQA